VLLELLATIHHVGNACLFLCAVYSSWEVRKLQCFKWIKERFDGPNVHFCVIGDGPEECSAARVMKWPFIKIEFYPDSPHRFPGLDMPTIQKYMDAIYESSGKDG
jgi:hypothetical protein